ncbi:MAG: polysaccharide export protein, partial [Selenomonadaceae bacterium]|nr:polysaccharide export protein [Selenomonadaceae bacterium]
LPYTGNIKLVGLTLDEARDLIHTRLSEYFKLPELNVYMKSYGPRKVYVMGNVNAPGIKEMNVDSMNVYAAVASAGGVDNKGRSKHIQLIRQIDGVLYYREINLDAFVKKHDMSQNIALEDGDIVYVPDSGKVVFSEDIAPYINIYATYRALTRD